MDPTWTALHVSGTNIGAFLNSLFSNNIKEHPCYGAFLNTKGRIISDAFIALKDDALIIAPSQHLHILKNHLTHQALFTSLDIKQAKESVLRTYDDKSAPEGSLLSFEDPRTPLLGFWHVAAQQSSAPCDHTIVKKRLLLGIAEGENIPAEKGFALHYNFHNINGLSFDKGCYIGQELITRTWHLGALRKNVVPCKANHPLSHGEPLLNAEQASTGHIIQWSQDVGIALCDTTAFGATLSTKAGHHVHCGYPFGAPNTRLACKK